MTGSGVPLYVEISDALRRRARKAPAGQALPSETELAAQFGVSRMTARQAVKTLEAEGLLYRVPGSGTFASGHEAHRVLNELRSFSSEMKERGCQVRSEVLDQRWVATDPQLQADLALAPKSRAVYLERVRYADDVPMALERTYLTPRCSPVLELDLSTASLHAALDEIGIRPTESFGSLVAALAGPDDVAHLKVAAGSPLLVEVRRIDDQHGTRIERTETRYAGNEYVFDLQLRRH
jgi:GntR family transcriptional regulator